MNRLSLALRVIVPAVWLGMLLAISFLEAPLKFQAPGITIELGLGIGRLVFTALNIVSVALLVVITLASLRPRISRLQVGTLVAMWVVLLTQVFVIRPPLNARTDALLAGQDPGESPLHYVYIAAELVIIVLIVVYLVSAVRPLLPTAEPGRRSGAAGASPQDTR